MAEPPAKRQRLDVLETIVICVGNGDDKKDFIVHESFATKSSKFLQAALNRDHDWKEAREKRIALPGAGIADFELYLYWLYTSQLAPRVEEGKTARGATLLRLYVLGDYLDDAEFCNTVMDCISPNSTPIAWKGWEMSKAALTSTWENTTQGSPLRKVLLLIGAYKMTHSDELAVKEMVLKQYSSEMLLDLFMYLESEHDLAKLVKPSVELAARQSKCVFHSHDENTPKCPESQSQ